MAEEDIPWALYNRNSGRGHLTLHLVEVSSVIKNLCSETALLRISPRSSLKSNEILNENKDIFSN